MPSRPSLLGPALAAAMLCVGGAVAQRAAKPPTAEEIDAAIDRGIRHLLDSQSLEGRWYWRRETAGGRAGATALAVFALLKSGVDREHPAIRRGIASLESNPTTQTYDAACVILALLADEPKLHTQWITSLVQQLVAEQTRGIWGYPSVPGDLSNTQYATLALRAAKRQGFAVPDSTWIELARALPTYGKKSAGFTYRTDVKQKATPGMTAAGIGCLAICRAMLGASLDPLDDRKLVARIDKLYDRSLDWLGKRYSVKRIRKLKQNGVGYYLYSVERLGALTGLARLGKLDWYVEGARYLVDEQRDDGSWSHIYAGSTGTSFALLFLSRATSAPITGSNRTFEDEQAPTAMTPWLVEIARDYGLNAVPKSQKTVMASSKSGKHAPELAFDGDRSTAWQCRERDSKPRLRVEFAAQLEAKSIKVGHLYDGSPVVPIGRAVKVEVVLDDTERFEIEMPEHPLRRGTLVLDPPRAFRKLELRVLERAPHADGTRRIGISEVEIQRP